MSKNYMNIWQIVPSLYMKGKLSKAQQVYSFINVSKVWNIWLNWTVIWLNLIKFPKNKNHSAASVELWWWCKFPSDMVGTRSNLISQRSAQNTLHILHYYLALQYIMQQHVTKLIMCLYLRPYMLKISAFIQNYEIMSTILHLVWCQLWNIFCSSDMWPLWFPLYKGIQGITLLIL